LFYVVFQLDKGFEHFSWKEIIRVRLSQWSTGEDQSQMKSRPILEMDSFIAMTRFIWVWMDGLMYICPNILSSHWILISDDEIFGPSNIRGLSTDTPLYIHIIWNYSLKMSLGGNWNFYSNFRWSKYRRIKFI